MAEVKYRLQVFDFGTAFAVGALLAEFEAPRAVGWGRYLNNVGECFVTIPQENRQLTFLRGKEGRCHLVILRNDEIIWRGWFAMEIDATADDVILYGFTYEAGLYFMTTDWNKTWTNAQIDTIVSDTWTYVKTTLPSSRLGFVATGTIEAPVTTSGGATPITIPQYQAFYKRALYVMKELAALAISDTTNTVAFEITCDATPTFNFWKNRGAVKADVVWQWGDDKIRQFRDYRMPIYHRNRLPIVGSSPNNSLLRTDLSSSSDIAAWGTMMEPLYFSYAKDVVDLIRTGTNRLTLARRDYHNLELLFHPNSVVPPGVTASAFRLSDSATVKIDRGITSINEALIINGFQVIWRDGVEYPKALLMQQLGA